MFSLEAPLISAGGVMGIKVSKKMQFFNVKIVRCPSGGHYKKNRQFLKIFFGQGFRYLKKTFFDFLNTSLASGLKFQNITLHLVQDDFKCTETATEVPQGVAPIGEN